MKIVTLLENNKKTDSELIIRHGLSLYIESGEHKILFDSGPDDSILQNAKELGVDLTQVRLVFISHAHYDHGSGLEAFLKINNKAQVFLSRHVQEEYYAQNEDGGYRYIGLNRSVLDNNSNRIKYLDDNTVIAPGVTILKTSEQSYFIPKRTLLQKKNGVMVKDVFGHELIMVIEEKGVLHVLTGCSHNGIVNMVMSVEKEFPGKKIETLVGGFHLMNIKTGKMGEEEEKVKDIARELKQHNISQIYTGHCTGPEALKVLQGVLGEQINEIYTGLIINI